MLRLIQDHRWIKSRKDNDLWVRMRITVKYYLRTGSTLAKPGNSRRGNRFRR